MREIKAGEECNRKHMAKYKVATKCKKMNKLIKIKKRTKELKKQAKTHD